MNLDITHNPYRARIFRAGCAARPLIRAPNEGVEDFFETLTEAGFSDCLDAVDVIPSGSCVQNQHGITMNGIIRR